LFFKKTLSLQIINRSKERAQKVKNMNSKSKSSVLAAILAMAMPSFAQTQFKTAENFRSYLPDSLTKQIVSSLDNLLVSIENENLDTTLIDPDNYDFNRNFFLNLQGITGKDSIENYFQGQLINLYPLENKQYSVTVAYTKGAEIGRIFNLLAKDENGKIVLSSPLMYNTRHWKSTSIGTITYFYTDTIDFARAEQFDRKNVIMAQKLKLPVRKWDVYMNEYRKARNTTAEEGLAYLWGNAYHFNRNLTDKSPDQDELVEALRKYIQSHPDVKLLDLFDKNPQLLSVSVKSTISGMICAEIEKQKGVDAIIELMQCGRGDDNYFKSIEKIIGINRQNFNEKVYKLLITK
jgi:hypothetical protein